MERDGIFAGDNPFVIARDWLAEAAQSEPRDPNAVALATVDQTGMPNVRVMLLKEIEDDALVFYTNYNSTKAHELMTSGKAALVMHWKSLGRQIRARGVIEKEDGPQADAYYATRPLKSRLGAWASRQSQPLSSRQEMIDEVTRQEAAWGDNPPRPEFWGGFRLRPLQMEFWADGEFRLHNRFIWARDELNKEWNINRLYP